MAGVVFRVDGSGSTPVERSISMINHASRSRIVVRF